MRDVRLDCGDTSRHGVGVGRWKRRRRKVQNDSRFFWLECLNGVFTEMREDCRKSRFREYNQEFSLEIPKSVCGKFTYFQNLLRSEIWFLSLHLPPSEFTPMQTP